MHPGVVEAEVQSEDGLIAGAAGTSSGTGSTFNMKPLLTGCQKLLSGLGLGGKKGPGMALQQIQAEPVLPEKASARDPVAGIHDKYRGRLTHTGPAAPFPLQSCMFHSRADFVHYLIPNQSDILGCPFYWGQMDRYQAEALLANQPEGSFLLRDSAQEDFVFSVSFRRYNRTLHARIEEVSVAIQMLAGLIRTKFVW